MGLAGRWQAFAQEATSLPTDAPTGLSGFKPLDQTGEAGGGDKWTMERILLGAGLKTIPLCQCIQLLDNDADSKQSESAAPTKSKTDVDAGPTDPLY